MGEEQQTSERPRSARATHATPADRFDKATKSGRVGAHRVTPRPRYFWVYFLTGLLGFALLTTLGILWLQSVGSITENPLTQRTQTTEQPPPTQGKLDPEATVIVLDGTPDQEIGSALDKTITKEKWGEIVLSAPASSDDITESYVYFAAPNDEASALGLAKKLGGIPVMQNDEFGDFDARLIVLIGSDYDGPGSDE